MVGGGTVLGSTIRTFYRLRFSIAHAIQDPYRAGIAIRFLDRSVDRSARFRVDRLRGGIKRLSLPQVDRTGLAIAVTIRSLDPSLITQLIARCPLA